MSSLWKGLGAADVYGSGSFFEYGMFDVEVVRTLQKKSKKTKKDLFIAEFEVLSSSNPACVPGVKRTWIQDMTNEDMAHASVKEFLLAIFGMDPTDKAMLATEFNPHIDDASERIHGPENLLAGMYVRVQTWNKPTTKGGPFTKHAWEPFDHAAMGLAAPDWRSFMMRYGFDKIAALPPPPPPQQASALVPGAPRTPDGKLWWDGAAWRPVPTPPPPPPPVNTAPPPPPPPPPMAPYLMPGTQYTPDGVWYLPPGGGTWIAMPPGMRKTG